MSPAARTFRAAALALALTFGAIAGIGVFLGFPPAGSAMAGAIGGVMAGGLLLAASRRAASFHVPDDPSAGGPAAEEPGNDHERDESR